MKKSFTWENFSTKFIKSIVYSPKTSAKYRPIRKIEEKESLVVHIARICPKPDEHFVRCYRDEITENFLKGSGALTSLISNLEKHKYRGAKVGSHDAMLEQFQHMRLTSTVMSLVLKELLQAGAYTDYEEDTSIFTTPKVLDMSKCIPSDLPLKPYQDKAVESLRDYFITQKKKAGMLVMPTGSGKTRVATYFLIKDMVAAGWQVIWLAHRHMLIEQTADAMYNGAAGLLKSAAPKKKEFHLICVSGNHASVKAIDRNDDVVIGSVQTIYRNLPYLHTVLRNKVMIVVDEAHHTLARSYRKIIDEIKNLSRQVKLLGLTATPSRLTDLDTARLMTIFDRKIIYEVSPATLIAKKILSKPECIRINTDIDFETNITLDEEKYIRKWGELSPETLERMARVKERNTLIADEYIQNKEKYGKTLIFALNAEHCISLCEKLQKRGVRCDYVYSIHDGNETKIAKFRSGELDVLVNIQIMTEGSDVPDIQTVFLTRPTSSDVLLMQMIGRGMRGKDYQGTETLYVVDFHDMWGRFTDWLSPEEVLWPFMPPADQNLTLESSKPKLIPWEQIHDILEGIDVRYTGTGELPSLAVLPVGWYDIDDEEWEDRKLLVFDCQVSGYNELLKNRERTFGDPDYTGKMALDEFFIGFGLCPKARDLQLFLDTYREEYPHLYFFKDQKEIDAYTLAQKLCANNVGIADLDGNIEGFYNDHKDLIDSVYGSQEEYSQRVYDFIRYPNGVVPLGMRIAEIPEESLTLDRTPVYDNDSLTELANEVLKERFSEEPYGDLPQLRWTDRPLTEYFGKYVPRDGDPIVLINSVLNSPDAPREVIKYVIYHELLHRDEPRHSKAFRAKEHSYPDWTEHERFLDVTFPKFNLRYAI